MGQQPLSYCRTGLAPHPSFLEVNPTPVLLPVSLSPSAALPADPIASSEVGVHHLLAHFRDSGGHGKAMARCGVGPESVTLDFFLAPSEGNPILLRSDLAWLGSHTRRVPLLARAATPNPEALVQALHRGLQIFYPPAV